MLLYLLLFVEVSGMTVTIFHNPRCSKSRETLALIEQQGIQAEIFEYLKTPLSVEILEDILTKLAIEPRDLMRKKEADYKTKGMDNLELSRAELIQGMIDNPKLMERPIVLANGKAKIGRPPEDVLNIL